MWNILSWRTVWTFLVSTAVLVGICLLLSRITNNDAFGNDPNNAQQKPYTKDTDSDANFSIVEKDTALVQFKFNSAELNAADKDTIQAMVKGAMDAYAQHTQVKNDDVLSPKEETKQGNEPKDPTETKAMIFAWADPKSEKNTRSQRIKQADARGESLAAVVRDAGMKKVNVYNMARGSNILQDLFKTDAAELNAAMHDKKVSDLRIKKIAEYLKKVGGPSKAVVMITPIPSIAKSGPVAH